FGEMRRFPSGILPIGDAICSFDPAFGQGMSAAVQEAEALEECLGRTSGPSELQRMYFRSVEEILDPPWTLSCGEIQKYPLTTGPRPLLFGLKRMYKDRVASCGDSAVIADFYRVVTMSAPPHLLLRPRTVRRVLWGRSLRLPISHALPAFLLM